MNARPTDTLAIAVAQLNPDRRRHRRQRRQGARRARAGRARRRRPRRLLRAVHLRLSAGGPRAQAGAAGRLPRQGRGAGARDRRRRPGDADRHALGRGRQALQRLLPARRRRHRGGAAQGRPAELRRVRREARVRAGADAGAGELPRRAARRADLRGHLGRRRGRDAGRDRRRADDRAERLALPSRQGRRPAQHRGRARDRERPADDLRQPGRRPGRAGVRRRVVRPACRPLARVPASGLHRAGDDGALAAQRQHLALRRRAGGEADGRRRPRGLHRLRARACATTSPRTASRAWCSGFPAASIPRWWRRWRSTRSAPSACAA